jgi:hypothetical protein
MNFIKKKITAHWKSAERSEAPDQPPAQNPSLPAPKLKLPNPIRSVPLEIEIKGEEKCGRPPPRMIIQHTPVNVRDWDWVQRQQLKVTIFYPFNPRPLKYQVFVPSASCPPRRWISFGSPTRCPSALTPGEMSGRRELFLESLPKCRCPRQVLHDGSTVIFYSFSKYIF